MGITKQIFLNGRFLGQQVTGVQRYALELVRSIDRQLSSIPELKEKFTFILLVPPKVSSLPNLRNIEIRQAGLFTGQLWEQFELPLHSRKGMLGSFCNTGPIVKRNQVLTLCDASVYKVPDAYSFSFRLWYRLIFNVLGRRANALLTISRFSRDELVSSCGIKPEKFTVTYPGVDHFCRGTEYSRSRAAASLPTNRPFILGVSSMSPHKNFGALIHAVALLGETDFDVVIAGGTNPSIFRSTTLPLPKSVIHLGYVSDEQLKILYSEAECFIYPSFYEGFGLPPLEAMSCGCPVIVAKAGSLPEVCGDAALYCNPHSPEDIANKIKMVMEDAKLRESLRQKGQARTKFFTWEKCAEMTIKRFESLLELPPRSHQ